MRKAVRPNSDVFRLQTEKLIGIFPLATAYAKAVNSVVVMDR